jgi:hypothetical protein
MPVNKLVTTDIPIIIQKEKELLRGISTFIPKKLAIIVGMAMTIVTEVRNYMTMFRLLEMTEAKASMVPLRMLL